MMGVSMVSANEILPEINPIKPGIETIIRGSPNSHQYTVVDYNPTLLNKQIVGDRTGKAGSKRV
jgi:hypothetical protein